MEMDQLGATAQRILNSIKANSSTTETKKYECNVCKDTEWIIDKKTNTAKPCKCREVKHYKKILETSGISEEFLKKRFGNFNAKYKEIDEMKKMAMKYTKDFNQIKNKRNNSIALLGQVGSGKTHLSIAIANNLMKQGIGVRYMSYRDEITKIKQSVTDDLNYAREINKYKNATVLLIDDLYKKATYKDRTGVEHVVDADIRVMFEIINHRYLKNAPIIISSEYFTEDIVSFDEGLGTRILEMCEGHIKELRGEKLNYRLYRQAL